MGAQDKTEEVLRKIHVLFAKAEPYQNSSRRVIVDKNDLMELLKELNSCMYQMMDEYELSESKKEQALREQKKQGADIIFDARKEADDIYAAAMMYTDRALKSIQDSMIDAGKRLQDLMNSTKEEMESQRNQVHSDQLETRARLQDMVDSEKYMRLIQDENLRLEKEKEEQVIQGSSEDEGVDFKSVVPEIHVNEAYLQKTGMSLPEGQEKNVIIDKAEEQANTEDDMPLPEIQLPPDLKRDIEEAKEEQRLEEEKEGHKEQDTGSKKSFRIGSIFGKES
ncbi:MAG: hypothetical protein PUF78_06220 [Lachnospiraceae bacterium]|nr:hypothetical protein [Lachnospiraceae bacterium]